MGQYCFACCRLSASSVTRVGGRPPPGRVRGRSGGRHCTAEQSPRRTTKQNYFKHLLLLTNQPQRHTEQSLNKTPVRTEIFNQTKHQYVPRSLRLLNSLMAAATSVMAVMATTR